MATNNDPAAYNHDRPLPAQPTEAWPGSEEKILEMCRRRERGEQLFHQGDAKIDQYKNVRVPIFTKNTKVRGWRFSTEKAARREGVSEIDALGNDIAVGQKVLVPGNAKTWRRGRVLRICLYPADANGKAMRDAHQRDNAMVTVRVSGKHEVWPAGKLKAA